MPTSTAGWLKQAWRNKTIGPIAMIDVANEIQRWLERH